MMMNLSLKAFEADFQVSSSFYFGAVLSTKNFKLEKLQMNSFGTNEASINLLRKIS